MCTCAHMSRLLGCIHAPKTHSSASEFVLQKAGNREGGLSQSTGPGYPLPPPPATAGLTGRGADGREAVGFQLVFLISQGDARKGRDLVLALYACGVYVSLLVSRSRAGAKMAALTGTWLLRRGPWKPERSHRS